jgi:hypothetical protein
VTNAEFSIKIGQEYPYNDRPPKDKYEVAALGILADLNDRRGIKHELADVDVSIREEIVESMANIIRKAMGL